MPFQWINQTVSKIKDSKSIRAAAMLQQYLEIVDMTNPIHLPANVS